MWSVKKNSLNPNPITKFFVVGLLGLTVVHSIHPVLEWMVIIVISIMYLMNGLKKEALKNVLIFGVLFLAPNFKILAQLPF